MKSVKGQLTIFIVVGILMVVGIGIFFLFRQGLIPEIGSGKEVNANSFLEACIGEKIDEAVGLILMQGGNTNPQLNKGFKFKSEDEVMNISYLCYNQNSYDRCVNQIPMLTSHIEKEVEDYIREDVRICFDELESNLLRQDYEVEKKYEGFEVSLDLDRIILSINGELRLTRLDETIIQKNIGSVFNSNLYNLVLVAHDILNSESQYCEFNKGSYMLIYSDIDIALFIDSEGEKIYSVKERNVDSFFRFAVRGCIIE